MTEWLTVTDSLTQSWMTKSVNLTLNQSTNHIHSLSHSPTHIYSLLSTHPLTHSSDQSISQLIKITSTHTLTHPHPPIHSLNQSHPLTLTNPHLLTFKHSSTHSLIGSINHIHSLTHSLDRMIDRSIWVPTIFNCKVESATHFIPFRFISVHSDTLL